MILRITRVLLVASLIASILAQSVDEILQKRREHRALDLGSNQITQLAGDFNTDEFKRYLNEIMIPRVPGSPGHDKVRDFITTELQQLGWSVTLDSFKARVPQPFGTLPFENIIATPNPKAERYLVYAAHYDSKWFADNPNFVAATDSAVSCAMMLSIAKSLSTRAAAKAQNDNSLSILYIFFDGEEAIQQWTSSDSIYGSRHLAKKWEQENFLPRIDMMVLLDLIGAADAKFYNYFPDTQNWYSRLVGAEQKLSEGRLLSQGYQKSSPYFQPYNFAAGGIEDDHIPFLRRNVPIVHCIVYPFPDVWHKPSDDASAIDYQSTYDITKIFALFAAEYLHLEDAGPREHSGEAIFTNSNTNTNSQKSTSSKHSFSVFLGLVCAMLFM